jgi:hypothetical protein
LGDLINAWVQEAFKKKPYGCSYPTHAYVACKAFEYGKNHASARPHPISVSERLPGPEDCIDEGWAWFFNQRIGWRQAVLPVSPGYTHWLPHWALPVPTPTNNTRGTH